ncbi:hypothetical protein PVIIG_06185 [Plasmodium vivax India VII]|uniref:Uncharacterized protein n=1 Tax=Plasmodium vivax India VII TaxID=1077284 RepID=A0A0J9S2Y9_PLAVI|nr:hypothetical protein PVIIG_06185 [Plasmodium vivax India VII]
MYKFFEDIGRYIEAENKAEGITTPHDISKECDSFSKVGYKLENISIAKEICEKFVKRYISLNPSMKMSTSDPNYKNEWAFFNYWLNYEFNKNTFNKHIYVKDFYNDMENYVNVKLNYAVLTNDEIFDINKGELDKMHILFNLYSNYYKIYSNDEIICSQKPICLDYSKKCVQEYKNGIIKCPEIKSDFCNAIEEFENKYETLKKSTKSKDYFNPNELISLPSYQEAFNEYQSELNKRIAIVTISIICSIFGIILILFYLYKVQRN